MNHHWTDGSEHLHLTQAPEGLRLAVGNADALAVNWKYPAALLAAEILRLAQRVRDLEKQLAEEVMAHQGTKMAAGERTAGLERQLQRETSEAAVTREEVREMQRILTERENALALAKAAKAELRRQLNDSESRGRQYCLELAEKAGEIRRLEERVALEHRDATLGRELTVILADHVGETGLCESAEEVLRRIIQERDGARTDWKITEAALRGSSKLFRAEIERLASNGRDTEEVLDRLSNAIEDGIAHVERARTVLIGLAGHPTVIHAAEHLHLAREALSRAAGSDPADPGTDRPAWTKADHDALLQRVMALEADLRFIRAHADVALAHSGKE